MASPARSFLLKIYMYKKPEARHKARFFGSAQAWHGPMFIVTASPARYFVPGLSHNHSTTGGTAWPEF